MDFGIKAGTKEIIDSGSFITFGKEPTTITMTKRSEKFSVGFIFEEKIGAKQEIKIDSKKYEKEDHVKITLNLINFNNALGSGLGSPLGIGYFDNKDHLFLHLWVKKLGDSESREVNYTFYLEKKNG